MAQLPDNSLTGLVSYFDEHSSKLQVVDGIGPDLDDVYRHYLHWYAEHLQPAAFKEVQAAWKQRFMDKVRNSQERIHEFLDLRVSAREGSLLRKQPVQETFKDWHACQYGGRSPLASLLFQEITKKYGEFNKKAGGWRHLVLSYGDTPQMEMEQM